MLLPFQGEIIFTRRHPGCRLASLGSALGYGLNLLRRLRNDFQPFPLPISNNKILQDRDIKTMVHFVFFALSLKRYLWSRIEEGGLRGASFFSFQAFTGLMAVFPGLMTGNIVLMARSFCPISGRRQCRFIHFSPHPRLFGRLFRRKT